MTGVTGVSGVGDDTVQQAAEILRRWIPNSIHPAQALAAAGLLAVPAAPTATGSAVTITVEQTDVLNFAKQLCEAWANAGEPGDPLARIWLAGNRLSAAVDRLAAGEETT